MKKLALFLAPLLAITFLTNCGGPKQYTITWKDCDGLTINKQTYKYDDTPSYPSTWKTPSKAVDAKWSRYEFQNQWEPSIKPVTSDITYTPLFEGKDIKPHTVK